jgi:site-specific DNA-methyltransferase (adenine-specific)
MAHTNSLYYGDNLVWLRDHDHFPNDSVDLIYLDPPFNSNQDYNVIFTEPGISHHPKPRCVPLTIHGVGTGMSQRRP